MTFRKLLLAGSLLLSPFSAYAFDAVWIRSVSAGNCMTVSHNSLEKNADILQWGCSGDSVSSQAYDVTQQSNGFWRIKNIRSGQCAEIPYGFHSPGIIMKQTYCSVDQPTADFTLEHVAAGKYIFHPRLNPNLCIGIVGKSWGGYAGIAQLECDGSDSQVYEMVVAR